MLNILGKTTILCSRGSRKFNIKFYVVKGNLSALLSAQSCLELGFLKNLIQQSVRNLEDCEL